MSAIKKEFEGKGVTATDLVSDFKMKQPNASAIINGTRKVGPKLAKKLHDKYGVDIKVLLFGEEPENSMHEIEPNGGGDANSDLIYYLKKAVADKDKEIERVLIDKERWLADKERTIRLLEKQNAEYEKKISADMGAMDTKMQGQPHVGRAGK